ncbi:unnamed protein product [Tuber melanosporum]|uniref:(Perigord truffle) hypothetical protein n=1 Tax=Tuber melanosporum (strain Mel28) TaxID=656061 RepID=D5GC18_TUBMM|nr:uncharacterized protein GSTUM_00005771001 [Tuber melanosporum]CAZ82061.1 unnamed protein product [Tuber melanosporum]
MAGSTIASFLTAPTIRLILPTGDSGEEDLTYSVHRPLLAKYTSLLQSRKPRDSYVLLDPSSVSVPTLDHALEFLYTGDYVLPGEPGEEEEADDQPLLHSTRPAAHLPRSPLMYAAMAGAIGVWGKPAPVFEKADNTSTYTSEYFPEQKNGEKKTAKVNGNDHSAQGGSSSKLKFPNGLLPSPPPTPSASTFPSYSPVLSPKTSRSSSLSSQPPPKTPAVPQEPHHIHILHTNLLVYRFASLPTVQMPALSALALHKLRTQFAQTPLETLPSLVIEFAREVFIARSDEMELREALVELVAGRARKLSSKGEFSEFVKGGGVGSLVGVWRMRDGIFDEADEKILRRIWGC